MAAAVGSSALAAASGGGAARPAAPAPAAVLLREFLAVQAGRAQLYATFAAGFRQFLATGDEASHARMMAQLTPAFSAASRQVISLEGALKAAPVSRPDLAALLRRVQEAERDKLRLTLSWQALRAAHAAGRFSWQAACDRPRATGGAARAAAAQQQAQQLLALMQQVGLDGGHGGAAASGDDDTAAAARDQDAGGGLAAVKPGFYEQQLRRAVADAAAASGTVSAEGGQQQQQQPQHVHAAAGCCHGHGAHADADELEPTEAEYTAAVREALQQLDAVVGRINEALDEVREAVAELDGGDEE